MTYVPNMLHRAALDRIHARKPDIFFGTCTPPDRHGFVSLSLGITYEKDIIEACVSRCQNSVALLAHTEFEAVPLFCELVCYQVVVKEKPPVNLAGLLEAALRTILVRDVRKHPRLEGETDSAVLSLMEQNGYLQRAFNAAELLGWKMVKDSEAGNFTLTDEEASCLLPDRVAPALASKIANKLESKTNALATGAHCGWLTTPGNVRGRYTFLRKRFAKYMAHRHINRHFDNSGSLPMEVALTPTFDIPLRLLAYDVASTQAAVTLGSRAQRMNSLLTELRRLIEAEMNRSPSLDDFFVAHLATPPHVTRRRLREFAATNDAASIRQLVNLLHFVHLVHRDHPPNTPGAPNDEADNGVAVAAWFRDIFHLFSLFAQRRVSAEIALQSDALTEQAKSLSRLVVLFLQREVASIGDDAFFKVAVPEHVTNQMVARMGGSGSPGGEELDLDVA